MDIGYPYPLVFTIFWATLSKGSPFLWKNKSYLFYPPTWILSKLQHCLSLSLKKGYSSAIITVAKAYIGTPFAPMKNVMHVCFLAFICRNVLNSECIIIFFHRTSRRQAIAGGITSFKLFDYTLLVNLLSVTCTLFQLCNLPIPMYR